MGPARVGCTKLARDLEHLVERLAVDDVEAQKLLLGLGERAVDHDRLLAILAQRGGGGGWQQPRHRAKLALPGKLVQDPAELGHDGIILLLGPGAGHFFIVIAKDCVLHAALSSLQGRASMPDPDSGVKKYRSATRASSEPYSGPRSRPSRATSFCSASRSRSERAALAG